MGLCPFPTQQSYWRKKKIYNNFLPEIISRNRFQLLLQMLHFSNNEVLTEDRLQKLNPLVNKIRETFQRVIVPSEYVCIDETLVPFRGRLSFLQYISNKRHKFGIKLFKLCLSGGYTYDFKIYCGKSKDENVSVPTKIVLDLMENLLDSGRTLCTDNYYTSVSLALALLERKTHLLGTLRSNRKFNPKNVTQKKLQVGETVAEECAQGIIVQKWKDRRDVLVLSTKYGNEMVDVRRRGKDVKKPKIVVEYNKYKSYIDMSDQMKSYNSCLRKSLKWYRKLALEILTGTALVNAFVAYQEVSKNKMSITAFREEVVEGLLKLNLQQGESNVLEQESTEQHRLEDVGRSKRRRCVVCYSRLASELGRKIAASKTTQSHFRCTACDKFYCLDCFFDTHETMKRI